MKKLKETKFEWLIAVLFLVVSSTYLFNFGHSNQGYVDPNIYSGIAGNYKIYYDIFEKSNSVMEKYSIFRVVHILILTVHQNIFASFSFYSIQIMFILINYITLRNFSILLKFPKGLLNYISIFFIFIIPTYILETRWNYVQVSGGTFTLIAIYYFIKNFYEQKKINIIIFGIFFTFATNTHLKYTIVLTIFVLVSYFYINKFGDFQRINLKVFLKGLTQGVIVGQVLIETIFYTYLKKYEEPILYQTFITPFRLAQNRVQGMGLGEYIEVSILSLLDIKYIYIFPIIFFALISNILLLQKKINFIVESHRKLIVWVAAIFNSVMIIVLSSVFLLKFPILEVSWYYNMIWPLFGLGQLMISNILIMTLTKYQKRITLIVFCLFVLNLFFHNMIFPSIGIIITATVIMVAGIFQNAKNYLIAIGSFSILFLQFLQPPVGKNLKIDYQQYSYRDTNRTISALEFAKDQIWFSSLYSDLHVKQNEINPIWFHQDSGLGDMQSSTGFCVTALHDCAGIGNRPDLAIWLKNNEYFPENIIILDTMDQTSLREARRDLIEYGYILSQTKFSPSLNFLVGIFVKS